MARKSKQPLSCPRVKPRDLEIYRLCKVEEKTQDEVGTRFKLSQPRVCKILQRVAAFYGELSPPGLKELPREKRLRAAGRLYQQRIDFAYQQSIVGWRKSLEPTYRKRLKFVEGSDQPVPHELIVTTRHGDQKHLDSAVKYAELQMEYEGFDAFGEVDLSTNNRLPEPVPPAEVEQHEKAKPAAANTPSEGSLLNDSVEIAYDYATNTVLIPQNKNNVLLNANTQLHHDVSATSSTTPGSGPFSGEQSPPRPTDADPKIVPTPLPLQPVAPQKKPAPPITPPVRSEESLIAEAQRRGLPWMRCTEPISKEEYLIKTLPRAERIIAEREYKERKAREEAKKYETQEYILPEKYRDLE